MQQIASARLQSLDVLRGAVMVLMAIDHVRVYSGVPAGSPEAAVFFTRWVTHFCAPLFVFLAGTAAYLHRQRIGPAALSRYLLVRGAWLIVLELTVIRLSWTFNLDFGDYLLAGVIWAIGWSMITLALLVRLPLAVTTVFGAILVAGHDAAGAALAPQADALSGGPMGWLWSLAYFGGRVQLGGEGGPPLIVLYTLIPWIGVMALGYAFGRVMQMDPAPRARACLTIGLGAVVAFVLLRFFEFYGDRDWRPMAGHMPGLLAFLNTSKYPASLLFLLMTIGPGIALLPWLDVARGRVIDSLALFGRVPLFYYLLHIPVIHLSAIAVAALRTPQYLGWLFENHPMAMSAVPDGYRWDLWLLYLVAAIDLVLLYFACRWYREFKEARPDSRILRLL